MLRRRWAFSSFLSSPSHRSLSVSIRRQHTLYNRQLLYIRARILAEYIRDELFVFFFPFVCVCILELKEDAGTLCI
jgi:hypothetical protein